MTAPATGARRRVADFWDVHQREWLAGHDPLGEPLVCWFDAYQGRGRGAVTREGFVEPYQGDLLGVQTEPRVVVLGLNLGIYLAGLQARDGLISEQIRAAGTYSTWVRGHPYDGPGWLARYGPNRYYRQRVGFTRRWLRDPAATYNDMLIFELYLWHSTGVTGPMRPPADVIDQFIWQPIAEIRTSQVFAFGAPWKALADTLGLPALERLGRGGRDCGSQVTSRAVTVYELPSGQHLVTESHSGSAGPPSGPELELLRPHLQTGNELDRLP